MNMFFEPLDDGWNPLQIEKEYERQIYSSV
jgi:hypothetical protein